MLTEFLLKNLDVFAWTHLDVVGINLDVMCHHLNIYPNWKSIGKMRRPVSSERAVVLKEKVDRLLDLGLINESSILID